MILGIIGTIASGKDAAANWLVKKYRFKKIVMSNFLRQEAIKRGIKVDRKALRKLQAELRKEYSEDFLENLTIEKIKKDKNWKEKNYVIDGLRTPRQVDIAKKKLKAKIILVDAKPELRFLRQKKRGRAGYSETYEQFLHEEAIENATFDFHETMKKANYKINNNGPINDLHKEIDKLMKKIIK